MTDNRTPVQVLPFRAVLTPHRSLSAGGFLILMTVFGLVCFLTGLLFFLAGAWPVLGFFGLDVLLLYVAFKLSYRSGRLKETLEIATDSVTHDRVAPSGERRRFSCDPFFARVRFSEAVDGRTRLLLGARGRYVSVGDFLTDDERRELARAVDGALLDARGGPRI